MHNSRSSTSRQQHSQGQQWHSTAAFLCALLGASLLGECSAGCSSDSASDLCTAPALDCTRMPAEMHDLQLVAIHHQPAATAACYTRSQPCAGYINAHVLDPSQPWPRHLLQRKYAEAPHCRCGLPLQAVPLPRRAPRQCPTPSAATALMWRCATTLTALAPSTPACSRWSTATASRTSCCTPSRRYLRVSGCSRSPGAAFCMLGRGVAEVWQAAVVVHTSVQDTSCDQCSCIHALPAAAVPIPCIPDIHPDRPC